jgi:16S rRNA (cytosine967-C5)-methyltransferase
MPRSLALSVLDSVLMQHRAFDESFDKHPRTRSLIERDRAFAYTLVATTLRRLGQLDAAIDSCLAKPLTPKAKRIRDVLRLGAAQLLFLHTPAHAAVDTSVSLAASDSRLASYKSLVNAVLHRLAREGAAIVGAQDAARLNTPEWMWRSWSAAYGESEARRIAEAHLVQPTVDLAVKSDPETWAAQLGGSVTATGAVRLTDPPGIPWLPGYADGAWWVQDEAAQMPARLLGDVRGLRVADIGAAPGGKTAQLANAGARVVAIERSQTRIKLLKDNLKRLRLDADIVEADARTWRPDAPFDAVLLDAPCTATGTIRRHPDIQRIRRLEDVAPAAAQQREMLASALEMVKPGGAVVYAVCSLEPEEGPGVVDGLAGVRREEQLRTFPSEGMDGFYAIRLIKDPA